MDGKTLANLQKLCDSIKNNLEKIKHNYDTIHTSQDDIKKAKEIFDKIIMTQTLNPIKIKEAYKLLFGLDATNTQLARMKVHAYFTYTFKGFDKTETAIPEESTSLSTETSTHKP